MMDTFLQTAKLINITQGREKAAAEFMYATTFYSLMRNGHIYKREDGKDGMPVLTMIIGETEFKCHESMIDMIKDNLYHIVPYEDTSSHFADIEPIPHMIEEEVVEEVRKKERAKIKLELETQIISPEINKEITLSEAEQAQLLLDETEYYKIGSGLNLVMALACMVFMLVVALFA